MVLWKNEHALKETFPFFLYIFQKKLFNIYASAWNKNLIKPIIITIKYNVKSIVLIKKKNTKNTLLFIIFNDSSLPKIKK